MSSSRYRELILRGKSFEINLPTSGGPSVSSSFGVWSPQKRLQFLLGGFERALGLNLSYSWRDETANNVRVEIRTNQTPMELERSILEHIINDQFRLVPPQAPKDLKTMPSPAKKKK